MIQYKKVLLLEEENGMKHMKNVVAMLCCLAMLLSLAACASKPDDGVPEGMKNATAAGAEFRLYVPSVWNVNTAYGVSGAYFTMTQQSTVSAAKYVIDEDMSAAMNALGLVGGDRLDWFWANECQRSVEAVALGGSLSVIAEDSASLTLDGVNAHRHHMTATVQGYTMHFIHALAERSGAFFVISFVIEDSLYAGLGDHIGRILDNFVFASPYVPDDYAKEIDETADAPEGMKLASNDDVAYRFYVPLSWKLNPDEQIFAAYLESDRSSVSVVPYMPDAENMSVAEFFALCEDMMKNTAGRDGYELLETRENVSLGGRRATAYIYRYTVGGVEYRYMQVVAAYKSLIYSMTYTALPENFDAHLSDVEQMIAAFSFR